jgi:ABC-type multidrug transport system fused ATPase/permease subunit
VNILSFLYHKQPKLLFTYVLLLIFEVFFSTLIVLCLIPLTDYFVSGEILGQNKVSLTLLRIYANFGIDIDLMSVSAPFLAANIIRSAVEILNRKLLFKLKYAATREVNNRLLNSLFHTDLYVFREYQHGQYMNVFNKEIVNISDGIGQFGIGLASFLQVLVYLLLPFSLNFNLALTAFLSIIIIAMPFILLQRSSLKFGKKWVQSSNKISSFIGERLSGYQFIVTNNYQSRVINEFNKLYDVYVSAAQKSQLLKTAVPRLFTPMAMFALILSVYFQKEIIPLSTLSAIVWSYISILPLISTIIQANLSIRNLVPSYQHVNSIIKNGFDNLNSRSFGSDIKRDVEIGFEFENICLSYVQEKKIFSELNLRIPAKSVTVLQGPSGVGKTTIINLLIGMIYPTSGKIKIDNHSIYQFNLKSYRKLFGYLSQETFLFNATLRDNLLISQPNATDYEISNALLRSGLAYEISNNVLALNTIVGENGRNLSGGQRQRLSLAMVLIKNPKVLILDEPTSALDESADKALWKIIESLSTELTIVVVTHRLKYVKDSFNIIKLDFNN